MGDGGPDIPLAFVPYANVIADGPDLQKGDTFFQTGEMKGSSFHAFNNGSYILLIPPDAGFVGADLVDGNASYFFQPGEVQQRLMGVDQQAIGKGGDAGVSEMEVEDGFELPALLYTQISQGLFFYDEDIAYPPGEKTAGDPCLNDDVRFTSANLAHECINGRDGTDACDEHVCLMSLREGGGGAFSWSIVG